MVTNALVHVSRNRAFAMKFLAPALKIIQKNWKGVTGHGATVAGALWLESQFDDDEQGSLVQREMGHELTDDEKDYAVQTLKDLADDVASDEIFTPSSKRLNEYITPSHMVVDLQSGKSWFTNNYISPNYVKAIKRNTVSTKSTYRRKK
jgi:hypothetical protein